MIVFQKQEYRLFFKIVRYIIAVCFVSTAILPSYTFAQVLHAPSTLVSLSPAFTPVLLRGIKVYSDNPLKFDFIVDSGDTHVQGDELKASSEKLIRYFLASLTIPDNDLWVNLSPYEKNRIIASELGKTEMGMDMLAQDYLLKQITASLIYPEGDTGKKFWEKIYKKAYEQFGTTNISVDTFNKVWIMPAKAVVYEQADKAFVIESKLKVMLEADYLALQKSESLELAVDHKANDLSSQIVRDIVIPELEKEVNTGKNFAQLRQIYNVIILSYWFKAKLKNSILNKVYSNQNKVKGVDLAPGDIIEKIYGQYVDSFKKGVMNFIKVEQDTYTHKNIPRKYFAGGITTFNLSSVTQYTSTITKNTMPQWGAVSSSLSSVGVNMRLETGLSSSLPVKRVTSSSSIKSYTEETKRIQQAISNNLIDIAISQDLFGDLTKDELLKDFSVEQILQRIDEDGLEIDNENVLFFKGQKVVIVNTDRLIIDGERGDSVNVDIAKDVVYLTRSFVERSDKRFVRTVILHHQGVIESLRKMAEKKYHGAKEKAYQRFQDFLSNPKNRDQAREIIGNAHDEADELKESEIAHDQEFGAEEDKDLGAKLRGGDSQAPLFLERKISRFLFGEVTGPADKADFSMAKGTPSPRGEGKIFTFHRQKNPDLETGEFPEDLDSGAQQFISLVPRDTLLEILKRLSQETNLTLDDLSDDVYLMPFAQGSHKYVMKATFVLKNGNSTSVILAAKREKGTGDIATQETRDLQKVAGRGAPFFAWTGRSEGDLTWYLEEFIDGPTVAQVEKEGLLTEAIRRQVVSVLVSIGVYLGGAIPRDIHAFNFMVREKDSAVIMVDLGDRRLFVLGKSANPQHQLLILGILMAQYGIKDFVHPEKDHFVFEEIERNSLLAPGEGRKLLEDAKKTFDQLGQSEVAKKFLERGRNMFWILGSESDAQETRAKLVSGFSDYFYKSLVSYLAKTESRRGPPEGIASSVMSGAVEHVPSNLEKGLESAAQGYFNSLRFTEEDKEDKPLDNEVVRACENIIDDYVVKYGRLPRNHYVSQYVYEAAKEILQDEMDDYDIIILPDWPDINAVALPTKTILLSGRLLKFILYKEELQGVLLHEIEHLRREHSKIEIDIQKRETSFRERWDESFLKRIGRERFQEWESDLSPILSPFKHRVNPLGVKVFLKRVDEFYAPKASKLKPGDYNDPRKGRKDRDLAHGVMQDRWLNVGTTFYFIDMPSLSNELTKVPEKFLEEREKMFHAQKFMKDKPGITDVKSTVKNIFSAEAWNTTVKRSIARSLFYELIVEKSYLFASGTGLDADEIVWSSEDNEALDIVGVFKNIPSVMRDPQFLDLGEYYQFSQKSDVYIEFSKKILSHAKQVMTGDEYNAFEKDFNQALDVFIKENGPSGEQGGWTKQNFDLGISRIAFGPDFKSGIERLLNTGIWTEDVDKAIVRALLYEFVAGKEYLYAKHPEEIFYDKTMTKEEKEWCRNDRKILTKEILKNNDNLGRIAAVMKDPRFLSLTTSFAFSKDESAYVTFFERQQNFSREFFKTEEKNKEFKAYQKDLRTAIIRLARENELSVTQVNALKNRIWVRPISWEAESKEREEKKETTDKDIIKEKDDFREKEITAFGEKIFDAISKSKRALAQSIIEELIEKKGLAFALEAVSSAGGTFSGKIDYEDSKVDSRNAVCQYYLFKVLENVMSHQKIPKVDKEVIVFYAFTDFIVQTSANYSENFKFKGNTLTLNKYGKALERYHSDEVTGGPILPRSQLDYLWELPDVFFQWAYKDIAAFDKIVNFYQVFYKSDAAKIFEYSYQMNDRNFDEIFSKVLAKHLTKFTTWSSIFNELERFEKSGVPVFKLIKDNKEIFGVFLAGLWRSLPPAPNKKQMAQIIKAIDFISAPFLRASLEKYYSNLLWPQLNFDEKLDEFFSRKSTFFLGAKTMEKEIITEDQLHKFLDRLKKKFNDLRSRGHREAGLATMLFEADYFLEKRNNLEILEPALNTRKNDKKWKQYVWEMVYKRPDLFLKDLSLSRSEDDDEDEDDGYEDDRLQSVDDDTSPFKTASIYRADTVARESYALDQGSKYMALRKILAGEKGVLIDPETRKETLLMLFNSIVQKNSDPELRKLIMDIIDGVSSQSEWETLLFALQPILNSYFLIPPRQSAAWKDLGVFGIDPGDEVSDFVGTLQEERTTEPWKYEKAALHAGEIILKDKLIKAGAIEESVPKDKDMSVLDFVIDFAQNMGSLGVRFLQLLPLFTDLPKGYAERFNDVFDGVEGQTKLNALMTLEREWPTMWETISKVGDRIGGGSEMTVYDAETKDGKKIVLKVLNPNLIYLLENHFEFIAKIVDYLEQKDPEKYRSVRLMLKIIKQWIQKDVSSLRDFVPNHNAFQENNDNFEVSGFDYMIDVPDAYGPPSGKFLAEEKVDGLNLTKWDELVKNGNDMKQVISLLVKNYIFQLQNGLCHSDVSIGNVSITKDKRVVWLDTNWLLKLSPEVSGFVSMVLNPFQLSKMTPEQLTEKIIAISETKPDEENRIAVNEASKKFLAEITQGKVESFYEYLRALHSHQVELPIELELIFKNFHVFDQMAKRAGLASFLDAYMYDPTNSSSTIETSSSAIENIATRDQAPGGIDFNAKNMNVEIKGQGVDFVVPPELQGIDLNAIEGVVPVIINIVPIANIFQALGLSPEDEQHIRQSLERESLREPEDLVHS